VSIWGERARQLQVLVDPEKLREKGVTLLDVIRATGDGLWSSPLTFLNASTPGVGGFIDTPSQRLDIRHELPISSAEDLSKVAFKTASETLRLADIATVVEGNPQLIGGPLSMVSRFSFWSWKFLGQHRKSPRVSKRCLG
jgi:multidrug efflux pump subunit AcrB